MSTNNTTMSKDSTEVDIFNWDDESPIDASLFEEESTKPAPKETDEEEETEKTDATKEEEPDADSILDFENEDDEDEDEDEVKADPKKEKPKAEASSSLALLNSMKERGLIDFELEDGEELDEEMAEELLEESYDSTIDSRIQEIFNDLPPVVKSLNNYVKNGGDINDFLATLAKQQSTGISEDMDLNEESNQEAVVRQMLKADGEDDDTIESQIEYYKDSGKLKKFAEKKFEKWNASREEELKELEKQTQQKKIQEKEKVKAAKAEVAERLKDLQEINGLKLSPKDKKEMPSYMYEGTVKLPNGNVVSQWQHDILVGMQDKTTALTLAKLARNKFDLSKLETGSTTKVTQRVKGALNRKTDNTPARSGTGNAGKKPRTLADYEFNI